MGRSAHAARMGGNAGFGIYELILVLVIAGVLTSVSVPATGRAMLHSRVNRAAAVVQMDLRRAYSLAARQRAPVRVEFDLGNRSYSIVDAVSGDELHRRRLGARSEFDLGSLSVSVNPVEVGPNGFASAALKVTLESADYARTVSMQRAGMVRIVP